MAEYRFYPPDVVPIVSTQEWHAPRDRAPHREQAGHAPRMTTALEFVKVAQRAGASSVVDLGAGDGGFLSMIGETLPDMVAWGYEFTPANVAGAAERGVTVHDGNFLTCDVSWGDVAVMTEVLEHLDAPHDQVRRAAAESGWLVCSSPDGETPDRHDEAHVWGWDMPGYAEMITAGGWRIVHHITTGMFQVVLATVR